MARTSKLFTHFVMNSHLSKIHENPKFTVLKYKVFTTKVLEFRHVSTLYRISENCINVILVDFNTILIICSIYSLLLHKQ